MPSFNQGAYIARAIESVLSQEAPPLELIIMDAGSTDQTLDVIKSVARRDARLRWYSERDRGQAHAVNKAWARARGEVVGWLNSDDIYYPEAFAAVLDAFAKHPLADVIYGEGDHLDDQERFVNRHPTEAFHPRRLLESVIMPQPSVFLRREIIERAGGLDESLHYCLDYEYWIRLAGLGVRFQYIPRVLSGTRMHGSAKTVALRLAMHEEINDMLRRQLGRVPRPWLLNYAFVAAGADGRLSWRTPTRLPAVLFHAISAARRWNGSVTASDLVAWGHGVADKANRAIERRRAA
jgi:glycosyltransferase involved in cell wall biosynthesis